MFEVNQTVTSDLNDVKVNPGDEKINTEAATVEEQNLQNQVAAEMSGEGSETVSEPDAMKTGEEQDEEATDSENEYDNGFVDVEDTNEGEEKAEEPADELVELPPEAELELERIKQEERKKAMEEFMDKYKPNEQKSENIRLHKENEALNQKLTQSTAEYLVEEKKTDIYNKFFDRHRDILPDESRKNLLKYQETADESLILGDPHLSKLNEKLVTIGQINPENMLVDLDERLEGAFWLSHKDEIIANSTKQAVVRQEMTRQKSEKFVEPGVKPSSPPTQKGYSEQQHKVADAWGVKL